VIDHPIVKRILRGGGGSEHDKLKVLAWQWLVDNGYEIVDFEIGGFDVLGLKDPGTAHGGKARKFDISGGSVVIDVKASKPDLYNHFKKDHISDCDIDGKFSEYGSYHYILAQKGLLPVDAVHDPWGLLETDGSKTVVSKQAPSRAYIGDFNECLYKISSRATAFLGALIAQPEIADKIGKHAHKTFLNRDAAAGVIGSLRDTLTRYCLTFETLYGYNPLGRKYLDGKVE
jgi:hypothetical protein